MKKRKRSVKLNRLVVKASSSTKRVARPTRPVNRAQPESSLSQTSPATTMKLKLQPKRPLPRPHKAFLQEKNAPEASKTCQEDENKGVEKGSNPELSSVDPNKSKGGHEDPETESTAPTAQKIGTPSSPEPASQGEKKEKEGAPVAAAPGNPDGKKDEAVSSPNTTTKVAPSEPPQPLKFAPKQTSRLCRKKSNIPEKAQTAEQEK